MKLLVTGGAGFIGSHLVERLVDEGHHVDVIDDLSSGSLANLATARSGRTGRLTIHQVDVRDPGVTELVARRVPDVVFHLAVRGPRPDEPATGTEEVEVNLLGALNVLEAARQAGVEKVVYVAGGADLYEPPSGSELPLRESHPLKPQTALGVAQRSVIEYLNFYRDRHALEFTVLVLGEVYGPRRPLWHLDSGAQTRDFVFIDDAVDAFVRASERGGGLLINIGTGVETPVRDIAAELGAQTAATRALAGPERFALDPGRARIHLGWKPWTSLEEGLAQL